MKTTITSSLRKDHLHISALQALILTAIVGLAFAPSQGHADFSSTKTNLIVKNVRVESFLPKPTGIPSFSPAEVRSIQLMTGTTHAGYGVLLRDKRGDIILSAGSNFPAGRPDAPYSYTIAGETTVRSIAERAQVTVPTANGADLPTGVVVLLPGASRPLRNYWQGPSYNPHDVHVVRAATELRSVSTGETVESPMTFSTLGMTLRVIVNTARSD